MAPCRDHYILSQNRPIDHIYTPLIGCARTENVHTMRKVTMSPLKSGAKEPRLSLLVRSRGMEHWTRVFHL